MNPTDVLEKPAPEPELTLTANDRCDNCGAQAYVSALLESGELMFCAHHWGQYEAKLTTSAIKIVDERFRLTA